MKQATTIASCKKRPTIAIQTTPSRRHREALTRHNPKRTPRERGDAHSERKILGEYTTPPEGPTQPYQDPPTN
ncbi:hypothetical protein E2C01_083878 [Portunus trituberculatus]|uniref:Uncharacterized protein n=1 Tax=Portunus trituberculatus TaxID=210409 RepID=A0A5B7IY82_PORTR|nr:hypothetical protein [Portunus trituberculatus]